MMPHLSKQADIRIGDEVLEGRIINRATYEKEKKEAMDEHVKLAKSSKEEKTRTRKTKMTVEMPEDETNTMPATKPKASSTSPATTLEVP